MQIIEQPIRVLKNEYNFMQEVSLYHRILVLVISPFFCKIGPIFHYQRIGKFDLYVALNAQPQPLNCATEMILNCVKSIFQRKSFFFKKIIFIAKFERVSVLTL